jgi:hypothetical protein
VVSTLAVNDDQSSTATTYTGVLTNGSSTDDTVLTISGDFTGTIAAGEVVQVFDNGAFVANASTSSVTNGTWTLNTGTLATGAHSFTAKVTNTLTTKSSTSTATAVSVVENGINAISLTVSEGVVNGTTITDATPTLSGSLTAALGANDVVGVYDGNTRLGAALVSGSSWSFNVGTDGTVLTPLTTGAHTFNVKVENLALNQVQLIKSTTFTVAGNAAPTAVVSTLVATDDVVTSNGNASFSGALTSGMNTDDTTLALSGGFTGTLALGDVINVYDGSTFLGLAATTATTNGTWTYSAANLAAGGHTLNVQVVNTLSGLVSTAQSLSFLENSLGSIGMVVNTSGSTVTGNSTTDTRPIFTGSLGTALVGTTDVVGVWIDGARVGVATVVGSNWSYTPTTALSLATHAILVKIEDSGGTASRMVQSQTITVGNGNVPLAQIGTTFTVTDDVSPTVGGYASGDFTGSVLNTTSTDDKQLLLNGTFSGTLGSDVVQILDNGGVIGTATTGVGTWTYTTPVLATGSHIFTAKITNVAAGVSNTQTSTTAVNVIENSLTANVIGVDNGGAGSTAPSARYVMIRQGDNVTSSFFLGELKVYTTNGTMLTLSASKLLASHLQINASNSLSMAVDGSTTSNGSVTGGYMSIATTVDGWVQIDLGAIYDIGKVNWLAASNAGTAAGTNPYVILSSTAIATATGVATSMSSLLAGSGGAVVMKYAGAAPTPTVAASQSFAPTTSDTTPIFSGTLGAPLGSADVLAIYVDGARLATITPTGLNWSFTVPSGNALITGTHTVKVQIEDAATGLIPRMVQAYTLTVLAAASPTTTTTLVATDDVVTNTSYQGVLTNNSSTDDTVLALSGTLSASLSSTEIIKIYDGSALIGSVTAVGSAWSYSTPVLAAGSHAFTAKVVSTANGLSGTTSNTLTVVENVVGGLQLSVTSGFLSGYSMTSSTPTLSGNLGSGIGSTDFVGVYIDGLRVGTASVSGATWSFHMGTDGTVLTPLTLGDHTVVARSKTVPPAPRSRVWWGLRPPSPCLTARLQSQSMVLQPKTMFQILAMPIKHTQACCPLHPPPTTACSIWPAP